MRLQYLSTTYFTWVKMIPLTQRHIDIHSLVRSYDDDGDGDDGDDSYYDGDEEDDDD